MTLSAQQIASFQTKIYTYYSEHGRDLPWRKTTNPYHVLISEIMLQQTQVDRVIPKYAAFVLQFPNFLSLAQASTSDVLAAWSGLGYNRRAVYLKQAAEKVVERYKGQLPSTQQELESLPGIGPATAASIAAFGFNLPTIFIETNIRSVYIFEFFPDSDQVDDAAILPLIEQTLDTKNPSTWYNALMDYGTHIKKIVGNPNLRSRHYTKQSPFTGSSRQLRGKILKKLLAVSSIQLQKLKNDLQVSDEQWELVLDGMLKDRLIEIDKTSIWIKD